MTEIVDRNPSIILSMLIVAVTFAGWLGVGCSSPESGTCQSTADCFDGEYCVEGHCQQNDEPGGQGDRDTGSTDVDAQDVGATDVEQLDATELDTPSPVDADADTQGGTDTDDAALQDGDIAEDSGAVDTDTGPDANGELCQASFPCESGHGDEIYEMTGIEIEPIDEPDERFGCPDAPGDDRFVDDVPPPLEVVACPNEGTQNFRVGTRTCTERDFTVKMQLRSLDDSCPADELLGDIGFSPSGFFECDNPSDTFCYIAEDPVDGVLKWQANFGSESSPMSRDIRLTVEVPQGVSFPYEVSVELD